MQADIISFAENFDSVPPHTRFHFEAPVRTEPSEGKGSPYSLSQCTPADISLPCVIRFVIHGQSHRLLLSTASMDSRQLASQ